MFGKARELPDDKAKAATERGGDAKENLRYKAEAAKDFYDKTKALKEGVHDKTRAISESVRDTTRADKQWAHDVSKEAKEILEADARAVTQRIHDRTRMANDIIHDAQKEARDEYYDIRSAAKDTLEGAKEEVKVANEGIREKLKEIKDSILGKKAHIYDKTKAVTDKPRDLINEASPTVMGKVEPVTVLPHDKVPNNKSKGEQLAMDFLTGGVIGAVTKTAMAPVERVKLLLQTQASNPEVLSGKEKAYTSLMDCVSRVRAEQGMKAFWRGNLVNCLRYAPQQGSALAFNDFLNNSFPKYEDNAVKRFGVKLSSGGLAGAIAATLTYPFDFARTRLASDVRAGEGRFKGISDCITTTYQNQGIVGLYRGWGVTVGGAFVYRAGQLGLFKYIQDLNPYAKDKGALGAVSSFCAVTAARTAVMPLNYPFDTIRRRLMLESEKPKHERRYFNGRDCLKQVLAKEGTAGLYKGMVPELFRGVGGSLVVVGYDRVKYIFGI